MIIKTSAEAQNQFGQLLDLVQREPVIVTRHGRQVAIMVSPRDMNELVNLKKLRKKSAKNREAPRQSTGKSMTPPAPPSTGSEE